MIDPEPARDVDVRTRREVTPPEQDPRRRVQVAAVDKLHLTVDSQSLCGLITVEELDVYSDEVALRAWNTGPLEQCAQCATALVTRIRQPARMDVRAADRRTGHREHPRVGGAQPADPGAESLMERDGSHSWTQPRDGEAYEGAEIGQLRRMAAALGIALDCLADECTVEQLAAARDAAAALCVQSGFDGQREAAAQLSDLIEARRRS